MNIEQERAEFEAFASKHGLCVTEGGDLYRSHVVAWMWKAWQARAALQSQDREPCTWEHDAEIDAYDTACGNAFIVGEGTPAENDMKFCCYCGRVLKEAIDHARRIES